ncbi:MAG: coiled coil protein [Legionella sp.]
MYLLNHLLAILLGITVLPLRILAYNVLYVLGALIFSIGLVVGLPILLALAFNNQGMPKIANLLLTTFIIFPVVTLLTTFTLAAVTVYLVYNTVYNMLESFWHGFKNGLLHGMDGFWHAYATQRHYGQDAGLRFQAFFAGVQVDDLIDDADFDGFQRIVGELQDVVVVREDLEVPDLEGNAPKKAVLFSEPELTRIEGLIEELAQVKEPFQFKEQFEQLKTLRTQYKDLSLKLDKVRSALESNDKSKIEDELIAYNDVETPILLVKQYKDGVHWRNVPAASYVTDKDSLVQWLKTNPRHPVNKDILKTPQPYNGNETRYNWYELKKDNCSSQELGEAATKMRAFVRELTPSLSEAQRIKLGLRSASQSFFDMAPRVVTGASHYHESLHCELQC